jgi:cell fate regulator YaaT (PSP1 superfamily)
LEVRQVDLKDAEETATLKVVGVRFRRATRVDYCDAGELDPAVGDWVVIETAKGLDLAQVVISLQQLIAADRLREPTRRVIRLATELDQRQLSFFQSRESEALERCRDRIERHGLPMKLLLAEYSFDGSRLTFFFSAEGRVDFRDLVRDLASAFRTRIELRQVGPRDETKLLGGVARCGRCLCCSSWLRDFAPVSMKMAKNQDLPLNDSRLAGICGRLMCCLAYENVAYSQAKQRPPCTTGSACAWGLTLSSPPNYATCPHFAACLGLPERAN